MNRSTPGLPVHHQLSEFTETHIHRVSDAIQPPHPLSSPSLARFLTFPYPLLTPPHLLTCLSVGLLPGLNHVQVLMISSGSRGFNCHQCDVTMTHECIAPALTSALNPRLPSTAHWYCYSAINQFSSVQLLSRVLLFATP